MPNNSLDPTAVSVSGWLSLVTRWVSEQSGGRCPGCGSALRSPPRHLPRDSRVGFRVGHSTLESILSQKSMKIETEKEIDGRWIAEVPELPGVMVYGQTQADAVTKVKALALRLIADRLEHGESVPELVDVFQVPA